MYEHNALGYWSGLALCLTKVRSSRARCPATALIVLNCYCFVLLIFEKICFSIYILNTDQLNVQLMITSGLLH